MRMKFKNGTNNNFQTFPAFGHKADIPLPKFSYRILAQLSIEIAPDKIEQSMSAASASLRTAVDSRSRPSIPLGFQVAGNNSPTVTTHPKRPHVVVVYPALLSRIIEAFRDRIALSDRIKDV